jgi:hypothetical protein
VIRAYIVLRDKYDAKVKVQKAELAIDRDALDKIETWLQNQLQSQGLSNFKGKSGTAFLKEVSTATVQDWDATLAFIRDKGRWELLERKVSKTVVEDYVTATGNVPPGVELKRSVVTQVRRG